MKLFKFSVWAIALAGTGLVVTSCDEEKMPDYIQAENRTVKLEPTGYTSAGEEALVVLAANSDWHVAEKDEWLHVSKESGPRGRHNIFISADPNTSSKERLGFIEITMGSRKEQFAVTQSGFDYVLELDRDKIDLTVDGEPIVPGGSTVTVTSNCPWEVDIPADATWLKATPAAGDSGENVFEIIAEENNSGESRIARIGVRTGDISEYVEVVQSGVRIVFDDRNPGYEYFSDDMSWAVGGMDQVGSVNGKDNTTLPIYNSANAGIKAAFDSRYTDFNAAGASVYAADGYLKFGKNGNQNAFMLKEPLAIGENRKANIEVSFRFAKNGTDKITLSVAIDGPGRIEGAVDDEKTLSAPCVPIDNSDKTQKWQWKEFKVNISAVTSETKIIIGETQYIVDGFKTRSGYFRGFIDDVKVTRTDND